MGLAEDKEALSCRRRGPLAASVVRICREDSLPLSTAIGWDVLRELEKAGHLQCKGRVAKLQISAPDIGRSMQIDKKDRSLKSLEPDLKLLDGLAKDRLDRKRKRMQSRQQSKASKR